MNKTGRGFTDPALFKDQLTSAYWQIAGTDSAFKDVADVKGLPDMPVTELRDAAAPEGDTLAIFYSGDGWADFDAKVSAGLMRQGIPVVGVSSLKYFWQAHTPEGAGRGPRHAGRALPLPPGTRSASSWWAIPSARTSLPSPPTGSIRV